MKERQHHDQLNLLSDTRELLSEVERLGGVRVEIRPEPKIRGHGRAIYVVSDPDPERHLILYDPLHERFLDHLLAHECGHIVRFQNASSTDQAVPTMTRERRVQATRQLLPDIERLVDAGVSERAIREVLPFWLSGVVSQLHNVPADIHIERWLWREFPGLREGQRASLIDQAVEFHLAMDSEVRSLTPPLIWGASNAMNYALLRDAGMLLRRLDLIRPYVGTPIEDVGFDLLRIVDEAQDTGLAGDHVLSEKWATRLGLDGWLEWRRIDELPVDARRLWEDVREGTRRAIL